MSKSQEDEKLATLSQLLVECAEFEGDFWEFAVDNEDVVRVALYAKNVTDGYAIAAEKLILECDDAIKVLQEFLDQAGSEE